MISYENLKRKSGNLSQMSDYTIGPKVHQPSESSQIASLKRQLEVLEERIEILEAERDELEENERELWK